jgi:hypothetical protein
MRKGEKMDNLEKLLRSATEKDTPEEIEAKANTLAINRELLEVCEIWLHNEKCTCVDLPKGGCPWCFTQLAVAKAKEGARP